MGRYKDKHGKSFMHNLLKWFTPTAPFVRLWDSAKNIDRISDEMLQGLESVDATAVAPSLIAKYTGSELTGAEREANAFNAGEAQKARDFDVFMAQHKYGFETQSMQEAGINPALVYGNGNLVPTHATGAQASSVSPTNGDLAGMLMSIARLPLEMKKLRAENNLIESEAQKNTAEANLLTSQRVGQDLANEVAEYQKEDRKEAQKLQNDLTRAQRREVEKKCDEIAENINLILKQETSEERRADLYEAQKILARAEADEITAMLPYRQRLMEAQTEQAQQAAAYSEALALKENNLIDGGYYDALIDRAKAETEDAEIRRDMDKIAAALREGKYFTIDENDSKMKQAWDKTMNKLFSALSVFNDNLNPIAGTNFGNISYSTSTNSSQGSSAGESTFTTTGSK